MAERTVRNPLNSPITGNRGANPGVEGAVEPPPPGTVVTDASTVTEHVIQTPPPPVAFGEVIPPPPNRSPLQVPGPIINELVINAQEEAELRGFNQGAIIAGQLEGLRRIIAGNGPVEERARAARVYADMMAGQYNAAVPYGGEIQTNPDGTVKPQELPIIPPSPEVMRNAAAGDGVDRNDPPTNPMAAETAQMVDLAAQENHAGILAQDQQAAGAGMRTIPLDQMGQPGWQLFSLTTDTANGPVAVPPPMFSMLPMEFDESGNLHLPNMEDMMASINEYRANLDAVKAKAILESEAMWNSGVLRLMQGEPVNPDFIALTARTHPDWVTFDTASNTFIPTAKAWKAYNDNSGRAEWQGFNDQANAEFVAWLGTEHGVTRESLLNDYFSSPDPGRRSAGNNVLQGYKSQFLAQRQANALRFTNPMDWVTFIQGMSKIDPVSLQGIEPDRGMLALAYSRIPKENLLEWQRYIRQQNPTANEVQVETLVQNEIMGDIRRQITRNQLASRTAAETARRQEAENLPGAREAAARTAAATAVATDNATVAANLSANQRKYESTGQFADFLNTAINFNTTGMLDAAGKPVINPFANLTNLNDAVKEYKDAYAIWRDSATEGAADPVRMARAETALELAKQKLDTQMADALRIPVPPAMRAAVMPGHIALVATTQWGRNNIEMDVAIPIATKLGELSNDYNFIKMDNNELARIYFNIKKINSPNLPIADFFRLLGSDFPDEKKVEIEQIFSKMWAEDQRPAPAPAPAPVPAPAPAPVPLPATPAPTSDRWRQTQAESERKPWDFDQPYIEIPEVYGAPISRGQMRFLIEKKLREYNASAEEMRRFDERLKVIKNASILNRIHGYLADHSPNFVTELGAIMSGALTKFGIPAQ